MFKQLVQLWMFGPVELGKALEDLAFTGADGIDLSVTFGENHNNLAALSGGRAVNELRKCSLPVEVVTAVYKVPELDFAHPQMEVRETAVRFTTDCIDLAKLHGAGRVLVSPSYIGSSPRLHTGYSEDWKRAADSLAQAAQYARENNVRLMIEPINRYLVSLVHTVAEARRMIDKINSPALCVVPDVFHMSMEEEGGVIGGIRDSGRLLECLHVAENNRTPVSCSGAFDWPTILRELKDIGFEGPLSHEPIELYYSENRMSTDAEYRANLLGRISESIKYLRQCMSETGNRQNQSGGEIYK